MYSDLFKLLFANISKTDLYFVTLDIVGKIDITNG